MDVGRGETQFESRPFRIFTQKIRLPEKMALVGRPPSSVPFTLLQKILDGIFQGSPNYMYKYGLLKLLQNFANK